MHNGIFESELIIRHSCDNPPCGNWEHLFKGTHQDNSLDASERLRWHKRTGTHHRAKLTEQQIMDIRANNSISNVKLSKLYDVTDVQISRIKRGLSWTHIN